MKLCKGWDGFPRALGIEPLTKLPATNASGCHQLAPPPQISFLVCPGLALTLGTLCWSVDTLTLGTHPWHTVDPEPSPMVGLQEPLKLGFSREEERALGGACTGDTIRATTWLWASIQGHVPCMPWPPAAGSLRKTWISFLRSLHSHNLPGGQLWGSRPPQLGCSC